METVAFLQSFASPDLDVVAQIVSDLGSERTYIALLLAVYLGWDAGIGRRLGVYLLLSFTLNFHLKELFGTARPFEAESDLFRSTETDLGHSFPSGHAQAATTFWGYLAVRVRRAWFWILAVVVVTLVSLSRLYMGLHVPVDVIGGILIGTAVVVAARGVDRILRRGAPPWMPAFAAGLLVPFAVQLVAPPPGDDSGRLMGGLAAFLTAPMLLTHRPPHAWWRRGSLVVLGVALTLVLLVASSVAMPEELKRHAVGGFVRYLGLGYVGLLLVPLAGRAVGLAGRPG